MSPPQFVHPLDGRQAVSRTDERLMHGILSAGKAYTTAIWLSQFEGDLTDPRYTDLAVRRNTQKVLEKQSGRKCRSFEIKYIGLSRSEVLTRLLGESLAEESLCYVQIDVVFEPSWLLMLLGYPFVGVFVLVSWIFVFEIVVQRFTTPEFDLRAQSWHRRALQAVPIFLLGYKLLSLLYEKHLRYRRVVTKRDTVLVYVLPVMRKVTTSCHWLESWFLSPQQTFNLPQNTVRAAQLL